MLQKIKTIWKTICKYMKHTWKNISQFFILRYGETQKGIILLFKLLASIIIAWIISYGATETFPVILMIVPLALLGYGLLSLLEIVLRPVRKVLKLYHTGTYLSVFVLFEAVIMTIYMGDTRNDTATIATIIIILVEMVFARTIYAIIKLKKRYLFQYLVLTVTLLINVAFGWLIVGEGLPDHTRERYLELANSAQQTKQELAITENNSVATLIYGTSDDSQIITKTTNLTNFTSYQGKLTEKLRSYIWGHGINEVPLSGKIWYPVEGENYPVLFIIHGNHTMVTPSYLGYDYLGEFLAAQGYVVVSVDQSFCNGYIDRGLIEENDARAILLLDNIKEILEQNRNESSVLYKKIDEDKIAIAGHSRGGEAVSVAALFNQYDVYPDDGRVKFNYQFNIKTVIAIAPTCDQYEPGDREVELKDINYFLIHGSNDMDVTEFMGIKQYENVKFSKNSGYQKAYLYIAGANHGQFNTEWGRYDTGFPGALFLNTASLIDSEEQQEILMKYVKVCLDVTLKENTQDEMFLKDCSNYDMPETIYVQGYENSSFDVICDYEEDSMIHKGSREGSLLTGKNMVWMEKYTSFTDVSDSAYGDRGNYAVRLNWNQTSNSSYTIDLSQATPFDQKYRYLQFDVLDLDDEIKQEELKALDFKIVVNYSDGSESSYLLSDYQTIYPPIQVQLSKLDALLGHTVYKHHFQTVWLPLEEQKLQIESIVFQMDQSDHGLILLDNIGLTN